ncbi:recombinase family protein [Sporosarcina saromensis]|uniref:Recombinase family protein n=1 Tax=Sporosarcina saromensis TaxID=359365 RepID=A0ABU4GDG7_9BACL|nr:recombinase family protein [Sporosarcina saromensis]MDW0114368.1 recombinase family protein [Sporosarcina saromensis]
MSIKINKEISKAIQLLAETEETGNLYGYARQSTIKQDLTEQLMELGAFGVLQDNVFIENGSIGDKSKLTELTKLLECVTKGDTIVVYKLDRLGRSVSQVISTIEQLTKAGIFLVVIESGIDTRKSKDDYEGVGTKVLLTVIDLLANLESTFIQERTRPAIEQAKANGVKFGRKEVNKQLYRKAVMEFEEANGTKTVHEIIDAFGLDANGKSILSEATFYRRLKEYRAEQDA